MMPEMDSYLQPRAAITDNIDMQHIQEVGGYCPLCGKTLLVRKGKRVNKQYQIAHIYPNSPNEHQKEELDGLERLGRTSEDFENKIALCKDCHGYYDDHTTKEEYLKILNIKKQLLSDNQIRNDIALVEIEKDIFIIIEKLFTVHEDELNALNLRYSGVKLCNKIEDEYSLLRRKIQYNVCSYFNFIKENLKNVSDEKNKKFEVIACEVRMAYLKAAQTTENKIVIFNCLVEWLNSKIPEATRDSCEIIISFFVQDCEVFDEIS